MDYKEYDTKTKIGRTEAFFNSVKGRFSILLCNGLICLLAIAPVAVFYYILYSYRIELAIAVSKSEITQQVAYVSYMKASNIFFLCFIPWSAVFALVCAGIAKVNKALSWKEPTSLRENFFIGIKENFLFFFICFAVNAVMLWLCSICLSLSSSMRLFAYLPVFVWALFVLPLSLWFCASTAVYKDKFFHTLKVSCGLYIKTMLSSLGFVLLWASPLLCVLIARLCVLIVPLVYALVILPLFALAWIFYCNSFFDKYINSVSFPKLVDKGLLE